MEGALTSRQLQQRLDGSDPPSRAVKRRTKVGPRGGFVPNEKAPEEQQDEGSGVSWGALPDEVINLILASLPLIALIRFRAVCKKWKALLHDTGFQRTRTLTVRGGEAGCPLPQEYIQTLEKTPSFADSTMLASDGGLLLLTGNDRDDLHVIDPSKASIRRLPGTPHYTSGGFYIGCGMVEAQKVAISGDGRGSGSRYYTVGMVITDRRAGVYNILAVSKGGCGRNGGPIAVQLYDSGRGSWRPAGNIPREPGELRFNIVGVVLHEGALHCLVVGLNEALKMTFRVLRYYSQRRQWQRLPGAFPRFRYDNRSSPLLFEHEGRLLFAGACRSSFAVWEYEGAKSKWSLEQLFPQSKFDWPLTEAGGWCGFFSHACGDFLCVGTYPIQKMCLQGSMTQPLLSQTSSDSRLVIYNMKEKLWRNLPACEEETRVVCWLRRKFLYDPSPSLLQPAAEDYCSSSY